MLELLKRFEQDSLDDPFAHPEKSDDDDGPVDDLEQRLAGIDLGEHYMHITTSRATLEVCRKCISGYDMGCADPRRTLPLHPCRARSNL